MNTPCNTTSPINILPGIRFFNTKQVVSIIIKTETIAAIFLFYSTVLFIKEYIQKQNYNFLPKNPSFKHFNFESKAIRKTSR